jgi:opacity protein-like surface antigen
VSEIGYNGGLGIGFTPMPKFSIDLRGELNAIVTGDTSQKFGNVTLGVTYDLVGLP